MSAPTSNAWVLFLKKNSGKGKTPAELSKAYKSKRVRFSKSGDISKFISAERASKLLKKAISPTYIEFLPKPIADFIVKWICKHRKSQVASIGVQLQNFNREITPHLHSIKVARNPAEYIQKEMAHLVGIAERITIYITAIGGYDGSKSTDT